jgi:hypothetical protein
MRQCSPDKRSAWIGILGRQQERTRHTGRDLALTQDAKGSHPFLVRPNATQVLEALQVCGSEHRDYTGHGPGA